MRFVILVTLAMASWNTSLANTTAVERAFIYHKRSELKIQTATKSVLAHALSRAQHHAFKSSNLIVIDDDDDDDGDDFIDMQVPYARPRLIKKHDNSDEELSDYVTVRLAVARARAMQKYISKFA